ncbi:MAG: hypothetical protein JST89_05915 [Cyanobacteria bacterium SZAS-4]|nr:hypothetical protein [Cyanobacteria bacterium SZAS-4]
MNVKTIMAGIALLGAVSSSTNSPVLAWHGQNFANNHPRRAEVLSRDANLNRRINNNKGDLGGHYGQLKREDRAIHQQERRMARNNGGYITKSQEHKLNREENHLNQQIKHDR